MTTISTFARKKMYLIILVLLVAALVAGCTGPDKTFGFQFLLKDSSGNPINGTKDVTIKLYHKDISSNYVEDFSETHTGVSVVNGLANLEIGDVNNNDSDPNNDLDPGIFAQPLWLEVTVGTEVLSPKQKLLGSPYAMTLVGGAVIASGYESTEPEYPTLTIVNSSTGNVLGLGTVGDGDFINACDELIGSTRDCPTKVFTLKNDGSIFTRANTKITAPFFNLIPDDSSTSELTMNVNSSNVEVVSSATGTEYVWVSPSLPLTLLGTAQKLTNVKVCYDLDNNSEYIDATYIRKATDSGGSITLKSDTTNHTSTSWDCYSESITPAVQVDGTISIFLYLHYGGTGSSHGIKIGNITLTLTED